VQRVVGRSTVQRRVQRFPLRRGYTVVGGQERRVEGPRAKKSLFIRERHKYIWLLTNVENCANVQRV